MESSHLSSFYKHLLDFYKIPTSKVSMKKRIGGGAYAEVYEGTWDHQRVAVKKLIHQHGNDEKELQELLHETKAMILCRSRFIVSMYGFCCEGTQKYLVMEYYPRGSLAYLLWNEEKVLSWEVRWRYALDAALGLYYLHTLSPLILHRDVKSGNYLLGWNGRLRLTDFGCSQIITSKSKVNESQISEEGSSFIGGTLVYSAPEVLENPQLYDEKSEVYSYGMVLIELATRKEPWHQYHSEKQAAEIRRMVLSGQRPKVQTLSQPPNLHKSGDTDKDDPNTLYANSPRSRASFEQSPLTPRRRAIPPSPRREEGEEDSHHKVRDSNTSWCPPAFRTLIERCYSKHRDQRPTMEEIVQYIEKCGVSDNGDPVEEDIENWIEEKEELERKVTLLETLREKDEVKINRCEIELQKEQKSKLSLQRQMTQYQQQQSQHEQQQSSYLEQINQFREGFEKSKTKIDILENEKQEVTKLLKKEWKKVEKLEKSISAVEKERDELSKLLSDMRNAASSPSNPPLSPSSNVSNSSTCSNCGGNPCSCSSSRPSLGQQGRQNSASFNSALAFFSSSQPSSPSGSLTLSGRFHISNSPSSSPSLRTVSSRQEINCSPLQNTPSGSRSSDSLFNSKSTLDDLDSEEFIRLERERRKAEREQRLKEEEAKSQQLEQERKIEREKRREERRQRKNTLSRNSSPYPA